MKLKSLLLGVVLSLAGTFTANAQSAGQVRFGVTGGMNVTNISGIEDSDSKLGFNLGFRGEYNFSEKFYANAGLVWSMKGLKGGDEEEGKVKFTPSYLQIPVAAGYRFILDKGLSIFVETGPYFAFGVCGKCKIGSDKVDYFGDSEDAVGAKRFDFGWGARAGVEIKKFQVHLGYEHGITKVFDETDCKNWNFNVGVSYMF